MPNPPTKNFGDLTTAIRRAAEDRASDETDSSRHLHWIGEQVAAIERGDFASLIGDAHDDVALDIFAPRHLPFVTTARGKADVQAATMQNFGAVEDQSPEIRQIFTEGQTVVLFGREHGKVRETGAGYSVEFVQRFTFRDGRLASVRIVVADVA